MIYRPQFAYPTPDGFRDQEFEHYFDSQTLPALNPDTTFASKLYDIPLTIDPDAEFRWRGVKFPTLNGGQIIGNYGVRFRDCNLNYLSDDFVPVWLCFISPTISVSSSFPNQGQSVVHEPEIICPPTGVVMLDLCSYDTVPWFSGGPGAISLCGLKRYDLKKCGCDGQ